MTEIRIATDRRTRHIRDTYLHIVCALIQEDTQHIFTPDPLPVSFFGPSFLAETTGLIVPLSKIKTNLLTLVYRHANSVILDITGLFQSVLLRLDPDIEVCEHARVMLDLFYMWSGEYPDEFPIHHNKKQKINVVEEQAKVHDLTVQVRDLEKQVAIFIKKEAKAKVDAPIVPPPLTRREKEELGMKLSKLPNFVKCNKMMPLIIQNEPKYQRKAIEGIEYEVDLSDLSDATLRLLRDKLIGVSQPAQPVVPPPVTKKGCKKSSSTSVKV